MDFSPIKLLPAAYLCEIMLLVRIMGRRLYLGEKTALRCDLSCLSIDGNNDTLLPIENEMHD